MSGLLKHATHLWSSLDFLIESVASTASVGYQTHKGFQTQGIYFRVQLILTVPLASTQHIWTGLIKPVLFTLMSWVTLYHPRKLFRHSEETCTPAYQPNTHPIDIKTEVTSYKVTQVNLAYDTEFLRYFRQVSLYTDMALLKIDAITCMKTLTGTHHTSPKVTHQNLVWNGNSLFLTQVGKFCK